MEDACEISTLLVVTDEDSSGFDLRVASSQA
jgi:hypothetical protein